MYVPPGVPGGSDWKLLHGCAAYGVYGTLREGALFLSPPDSDGKETIGDDWRDIEVRHVWGDRSVWESPYAAQSLCQEVSDGARDGKPMRNFTSLCVKGTNHFVRSSVLFSARCILNVLLSTGAMGRSRAHAPSVPSRAT